MDSVSSNEAFSSDDFTAEALFNSSESNGSMFQAKINKLNIPAHFIYTCNYLMMKEFF
jgi:hypothetical protein